VPAFTNDQWLIIILVFLLGLIIGMALMAGGKWKRRYREEAALRKEDARRCEALEAENKRLQGEAAEMESLRHAAAKSNREEVERIEEERREAERRQGDRRQGDRRDPDPL
jgi:cell division protein FtsB